MAAQQRTWRDPWKEGQGIASFRTGRGGGPGHGGLGRILAVGSAFRSCQMGRPQALGYRHGERYDLPGDGEESGNVRPRGGLGLTRIRPGRAIGQTTGGEACRRRHRKRRPRMSPRQSPRIDGSDCFAPHLIQRGAHRRLGMLRLLLEILSFAHELHHRRLGRLRRDRNAPVAGRETPRISRSSGDATAG